MFSIKEILQILYIFAYCFTNSLSLKTPKLWSSEFVWIRANSSDESKIKVDFKLNRIERGVFTLSGAIDIRYDVPITDKFMIEKNVYRSATGSGNYKLTPFAIRKMDLYDFMDTFYKELLMESLRKCSNAPYFKNKFQRPLQRKTYKLINCTFSTDSFPSYVPEGYYKFNVFVSGAVPFTIEYLTKVEHTI